MKRKKIEFFLTLFLSLPMLWWFYFVISLWYYPVRQVNVFLINDTSETILYKQINKLTQVNSNDTIMINTINRTKIKNIKDLKCSNHSGLKEIKFLSDQSIRKDFKNEENWQIIIEKNKMDCYFHIEN